MECPPHLRKNYLFKSSPLYNSNCNKLSKYAKTFFKILHVVLALDFGFFNYKTFARKLFFKVLSICQCYAYCMLFFGIVIYKPYNIHMSIWSTMFLVQYVTYVTSFAISGKNISFKKFCDELEIFDSKMAIRKSYRFELKLFGSLLIPFVIKPITNFMQKCAPEDDDICIKSLYLRIFSVILTIGVDIILILNAIVFYLIYCRLVTYTNVLSVKRVDLKAYHHLYKFLVDLAENIKRTFDPVFVSQLLVQIYYITMMMYWFVVTIKFGLRDFTSLYVIFEYCLNAQSLGLTFAPAIFGGMLSTQANLLKVELYNLLLEENDKTNAKKIKEFIKYIEARPFEFYICGIIPLNANIIAIILNLCVTYFIVLLQLTHVY